MAMWTVLVAAPLQVFIGDLHGLNTLEHQPAKIAAIKGHWPNIMPPDISIWQAAAPVQSMSFALVGALFIIPFILAYTAWSYYVFRGKVKAGEDYR